MPTMDNLVPENKQIEAEKWVENPPFETDGKIPEMRKIFSHLSEGILTKKTSEYEKYFKQPKESYPVQRWFRCREGFSINLIRKIITENTYPQKILDPFCGSGTTLIAARDLGINSIGFDVNPLVTFVAKVKTRKYSNQDIEKLEKLIPEILQITINSERAPTPKFAIINKVFNTEILDVLLKLKNKICQVPEEKHRDFLKLGWLAILETVSNTRKEGNGIKYKFTKRTDKGYISQPQHQWEEKHFGKAKTEHVIRTLKSKYQEMISDAKKASQTVQEPTVFTESALKLTNFLDKEISIALFSPPYANCFDYFEIFKVELWMGDFVEDRKDIGRLRSQALRSNVNTDLNVSRGVLELSELNELLNLIDEEKLWDKKLKKLIKGYFEDMSVVLKEIYNVLEPDGKCIIIVGNSAYADILIPTDLLLSKIAKQIGFQNIEIRVARHLTTSSQQRKKLLRLKDYLRESIIHMEKTKETLKVENIPTDQSIALGQKFIITSNNVANLTHNIHKYPSKFIPQIPRWGIQKYLRGENRRKILDPFCGSGTTLVEGILAGHDVFGMDIDPLARLITKVKITPIDEDELIATYKEVVEKVERREDGFFKPNIPTLNHWFAEKTIKDLSVIRDVIEEYRHDQDIYDFLIVSLSSIIRKVSNADDQSQKTYVSHTNPKQTISAKHYFLKKLEDHVDRLIQFSKAKPEGIEYYIFDGADAREVDKSWNAKFPDGIDLAITSPPYVKAVDYIYTQMAEYFWVGDLFGLSDQKSQNAYKVKYIGTKQIYAEEYSELRLLGIENLDKKTMKIYEKNKKFAYITYKFFNDMKLNLQSIHNVLKDDAHYIVVVGDCSVGGEFIPVHEYIAEIADRIGYDMKNLFYYKIRNRYMRFPRNGRGGLITNDWVVDLEKS